METVSVVEVLTCDVCGEDLTKTKCQHFERRTRIDIVFEKVVEHVDAEVKQCPICDSIVKGSFPRDMSGLVQYGNGLKAYVINLIIAQMIALNPVQKLVTTLIGEVISPASLLKFVLRLHEALESWETQKIEQMLALPVIHVDETSLRVDKKNQWIHVYSGVDLTLKFLHPRRGSEAINLCQGFCRISSYLQTMTNRGINPLIAIQIALAKQM